MKSLIPKALLAVLLVVLNACGGGGEPPTPGELGELIVSGDQADAEVGVQVLKSYEPATITTQFNPEAGGQTVYEVAGTTPKGKAFKAVLLGDEGLNLNQFKGNMRMKARLRRIQGQVILAGRLIPTQAVGTQALGSATPIAFVAGGANVRFTGPEDGTVYELNGMADFKGTCDADGLSGAYGFKQGSAEIQGALNGLKLRDQAVPCVAGAVEGQIPVALSYTAVETHMGIIFSAQGSLVTQAAGGVGAQAAAPIPSTGVAIGNTLPEGVNRAVVRVKSNVKELGNTSGAELVSFNSTSGTMIFNRLIDNLSGLTEGNIITSAPRTNAPDGFMRRVTRVQNTNDGKVEVRTERAELSDMAEELDVSVDRAFSTVDQTRATALERGEVIYAAEQIGPSAQALGSYRANQTLVLYDQDGNHSTTDDQVTVTGNLEIEPRIVIKLKCSGLLCTDPTFTGKFVLNETATLTVSAKLKKELHESKQIARFVLGAIAVGPLVFVPDIVINLDLDGVIRVEVEMSVTQTLTIEAGVKYNKDTGWDKINIANSTITRTGPTFEGSVDVTASLSAALRLMLWGVAGVSAEAGVYVTLEAQYPGTPAWTITPGIRGDIGVDIDLLVFQKEFNQNLFNKTFTQIVAPNERPKFLEVGSRYLCDDGYSARIGAAVGGGLAGVTLFALTDDKEDGAGKGSIDWSSSRDGSLGRTRQADKHTLRPALSNGTHTITALLTDSGGATRTREFTVQLAGDRCQFPSGLPDVNITDDDNPNNLPFPPLVVISADRSLTLHGRTSTGALPLCSVEIVWKSNLERRNAGTSTGGIVAIPGIPPQNVCNHTFTHTYKNLSPQTITAKITHNGMTVTDSIEVGAQIPLPLTLGNILMSAPSGTRYVYTGDQVTFQADGSNVAWSSSVATDDINGKTGNNVTARFNTIGPRTIVARVGSDNFNSKSFDVNVLSALAR